MTEISWTLLEPGHGASPDAPISFIQKPISCTRRTSQVGLSLVWRRAYVRALTHIARKILYSTLEMPHYSLPSFDLLFEPFRGFVQRRDVMRLSLAGAHN